MKNLLVIFAACTIGMVQAMELDGIAAKVNDDVITVSDVIQNIQRNREAPENVDYASNKELMKSIYDKSIDELIERHLVLQEAKRKKLDMQEWIVDNRVREIIHDAFGGDRNNLLAVLKDSKITFADWRETIREDLIISAMRWQYVDKNAQPIPAEMQAEYDAHKDLYKAPAKVSVRIILLKPSGDDDPANSVTARGKTILERLDHGADFASLAKEYSADSHSQKGGLWADVSPDEAFVPEICNAIAPLRVGAYSRLVDLNGWAFIVRKESESAAGQMSFEESYDNIAKAVRKRKSEAAFKEWIGNLRRDSYVKINPMPVE